MVSLICSEKSDRYLVSSWMPRYSMRASTGITGHSTSRASSGSFGMSLKGSFSLVVQTPQDGDNLTRSCQHLISINLVEAGALVGGVGMCELSQCLLSA